MNNKKGFTLIEIIVSILLIVLIAGSVIGITLTNKNKKEEKIEEVTRKIQEAAGVYLAINKEIDSTIEQNILNGGSGYVIPLKTLIDEGYIGDNHIKTLEDNGVKINIDKDYMLAGVFSNTNYCDNGESTISIEPSYKLEKESTSYYLCNFTTEKKYLLYDLDGGYFSDNSSIVEIKPKGSSITIKNGTEGMVKKNPVANISYIFKKWTTEKNCGGEEKSGEVIIDNNMILYACYEENVTPTTPTLKDIMSLAKFTNNYDKIAVSEEWCKNNPGYDSSEIVCDENGIYIHHDTDSNIVYYYSRGAVKNNYLKFNDQMWRILWVSNDNKMKLVLDDEINVKINDEFNVSKNDTLYYIKDSKVCQNQITETEYINSSGNCNSASERKFWYLHSSGAKETLKETLKDSYKLLNERYRITYDLSKSTKINDYDLFIETCSISSTNRGKCNNTNYSTNIYDPSKNIYYKTMINNFSYLDDYDFIDTSSFCDINEYSSEDINWKDKVGVCNKKDNLSKSKITYITLGELKRAGVGTLSSTSNFTSTENYLLPKDSNKSYYIQDFYTDVSEDYNNFTVSNNGVLRSDLFHRTIQTYENESYPNSSRNRYKTYYVYYKNATELCGYNYCKSGDYLEVKTDTDTKYVTYYKYQNIYNITFAANAIKPAIIIDLNKINLSNNSGTISDPYVLST